MNSQGPGPPTTSRPVAPPSEEQCGVFWSHNQTKYDFTGGEYGEIPFTLIINAIVWVVLIILFAILRKIAWDYGRIALVSRTEENAGVLKKENRYNVWTSLFFGERDKPAHGSQESLDTHLHSQDKGFCAWIPAFFRVKDADILQKCGHDAIQYLSFQRYLIIYTTIICILAVAVVIPTNFSGDIIGNATDFGHTTIGNLDPKSPLLWIHALLAIVFLIIIVALMHHFSRNLEYQEDDQVSRTLMISNIPTHRCFKNIITQHFQEAYPETSVVDVQFAYNISNLVILDKKLKTVSEARMNSQMECDRTGIRPTMRPHVCGRCCCGSQKVDAIEYYSALEADLKLRCEEEKVTAYQDPQGIAFVSFQTDNMAEKVLADFGLACKGSNSCPPSSVAKELNIIEWDVKYAPSPENIYWENLTKSGIRWWLFAILVNGILVILLFFFTTPLLIINNLDKIEYFKGTLTSPVIQQFLPTLLLWTFACLLPNAVYYSDQYIGHWTRTSEHHFVMIKCFIFLLLMVLILPSLGLFSVNALFQWLVKDSQNDLRWKCIFLPGNGAFFVNYVITSAFIGTALELMRFSELMVYSVRLFFARSSAEESAVRKTTVWEFQFGIQYAWMLCVFAVVVAYSISCPLIVPFGLIHMIFKHMVDRYNIYFAYRPSRISKGIHNTAITFVVASVILLQCNIVFFTAVRSEAVSAVFFFSFVALFASLLAFTGRVCFGWFKHFNPLKYKKANTGPESEAFNDDGMTTPTGGPAGPTPFVASVLLNPDRDGDAAANADYATPAPVNSYGSISSHTPTADTGFAYQP